MGEETPCEICRPSWGAGKTLPASASALLQAGSGWGALALGFAPETGCRHRRGGKTHAAPSFFPPPHDPATEVAPLHRERPQAGGATPAGTPRRTDRSRLMPAGGPSPNATAEFVCTESWQRLGKGAVQLKTLPSAGYSPGMAGAIREGPRTPSQEGSAFAVPVSLDQRPRLTLRP